MKNNLNPADVAKGALIAAGIRKARCRYCKKPGLTRLCACLANMELQRRNYRLDWYTTDLLGPISKLP